jgi:hypothetical protein
MAAAVVWSNLPHRLRQKFGVGLSDAMSARANDVRNVGSNPYNQLHLDRAMAGTRRYAACDHTQHACVAAADADVVRWAESCYTMHQTNI